MMSGIGTTHRWWRGQKATRRSRRVASGSESSHSEIQPLEESVQKLEVERVDCRAEDWISLPKRRDALLANLLLRHALV